MVLVVPQSSYECCKREREVSAPAKGSNFTSLVILPHNITHYIYNKQNTMSRIVYHILSFKLWQKHFYYKILRYTEHH